MNELEKALRVYCTMPKGHACIPEVAEALKRLDDLHDYVAGLSSSQLNGEEPIIRAYQTPKNPQDKGCLLALYWKPEGQSLEVDWDDTGRW